MRSSGLPGRAYLTLIKPAPNNNMEEAKVTNASSNVDSCNSFMKREIIPTLPPTDTSAPVRRSASASLFILNARPDLDKLVAVFHEGPPDELPAWAESRPLRKDFRGTLLHARHVAETRRRHGGARGGHAAGILQ